MERLALASSASLLSKTLPSPRPSASSISSARTLPMASQHLPLATPTRARQASTSASICICKNTSSAHLAQRFLASAWPSRSATASTSEASVNSTCGRCGAAAAAAAPDDGDTQDGVVEREGDNVCVLLLGWWK